MIFCIDSKLVVAGVEATGERAFSLRTSSQMLDDDSDEDEGDFDFDGDLFMSELQQVLGLRGAQLAIRIAFLDAMLLCDSWPAS